MVYSLPMTKDIRDWVTEDGGFFGAVEAGQFGGRDVQGLIGQDFMWGEKYGLTVGATYTRNCGGVMRDVVFVGSSSEGDEFRDANGESWWFV